MDKNGLLLESAFLYSFFCNLIPILVKDLKAAEIELFPNPLGATNIFGLFGYKKFCLNSNVLHSIPFTFFIVIDFINFHPVM